MPTIKELKARVDALQHRVAPQASIAQRLKAARENWRAMTPAQQQAKRAEQLAQTEPPKGGMRHRLWAAAQRVAAMQSRLHA